MKEEREAMANLAADLDRVISTVHQEEEEEEGSDEEFEFAVVATDAEGSGAADEIFANGRILPVYPVFNRHLLEPSDAADADQLPIRRILIADRVDRSGSASSSSSAESDAAAPAEGSYCVWEPTSRSAPQSPERWKKSSSTGSSGPRGWRLRDLVVGRSRSDGKEKFHFIGGAEKGKRTAKGAAAAAEESNKGKGAKKEKEKKEMDMVTAHRLLYVKGAAPAAKGGRRSFLPYRQVGLFYGAGNEFGL